MHIRRRFTADEEKMIGPVIDCRGTDEWQKRFDIIREQLPPMLVQMALDEKEQP